jgi:DNA-binding transcriptional LysR family regulator
MLDQLPIFLAVARTASFTAAARQTGLTVAAISKAIAKLERDVGVSLFLRTTRAVNLTQAGETLFTAAKKLEQDERDLRQALLPDISQPKGRLRVAMPVSLGSQGRGRYSLTRAMVAFAQAFPAITLETILSDAQTDPVRERLDVAVRIAPLTDSSTKTKVISPCPLVLVASPDYLKRTGSTPTKPNDLKQHKWLAYQNLDRPGTFTYLDANRRPVNLDLTYTFASNNGDQLLIATLAGLGIAALPRLFLEDDLSTGRLVQILPDLILAPELYLALYFLPSVMETPPATRVFIDFMVDWFKECAKSK